MSAPGFWDWSLEQYARPGAADTLLALQDENGLNVNILLWCGWCARDYAETPELVLRKAIDLSGAWTRDVTGPLRQARRALKSPPPQAGAAAAGALRTEIKACELGAERIEQDMLAALARDMLSPAGAEPPTTRARRNIARYIYLTGAARRPGFSMLPVDSLVVRFYPDAEQAGASADR